MCISVCCVRDSFQFNEQKQNDALVEDFGEQRQVVHGLPNHCVDDRGLCVSLADEPHPRMSWVVDAHVHALGRPGGVAWLASCGCATVPQILPPESHARQLGHE